MHAPGFETVECRARLTMGLSTMSRYRNSRKPLSDLGGDQLGLDERSNGSEIGRDPWVLHPMTSSGD